MNAQRARLSDGRWHFRHGPIDCVIGANGGAQAVGFAHEAAWGRFETILEELVAELAGLRQHVTASPVPRGVVARRMRAACAPHAAMFITPMAAVAGAVADELIACYRRVGIDRAWVDNGGDIALHLTEGTSVRVGLVADLTNVRCVDGRLDVDGRFEIDHAMPIRGVATSGWRGRSFSLGIADSVTVLARTAAAADAAATMIANAVDVDDPRIVRRPASHVKDDSDLGDRLVTVDVPPLGADAARRALRAGLERALVLQADGSVEACVLVCQGLAMSTEAARVRLPEAA